MASLSPKLSRSNSQSNLNASYYQSSDHGYDYNMVDDGPEREPTRKNVSILEMLQRDVNTMVSMSPQLSRSNSQTNLNSSDYQRADDGYDYNMVDDGPENTYTKTEPHIWQRPAGGRREKLPDGEPSLIEAAERCGASLEKLKKHAYDSKAKYTRGTKRKMLDKVDLDVCPFTVQ